MLADAAGAARRRAPGRGRPLVRRAAGRDWAARRPVLVAGGCLAGRGGAARPWRRRCGRCASAARSPRAAAVGRGAALAGTPARPAAGVRVVRRHGPARRRRPGHGRRAGARRRRRREPALRAMLTELQRPRPDRTPRGASTARSLVIWGELDRDGIRNGPGLAAALARPDAACCRASATCRCWRRPTRSGVALQRVRLSCVGVRPDRIPGTARRAARPPTSRPRSAEVGAGPAGRSTARTGSSSAAQGSSRRSRRCSSAARCGGGLAPGDGAGAPLRARVRPGGPAAGGECGHGGARGRRRRAPGRPARGVAAAGAAAARPGVRARARGGAARCAWRTSSSGSSTRCERATAPGDQDAAEAAHARYIELGTTYVRRFVARDERAEATFLSGSPRSSPSTGCSQPGRAGAGAGLGRRRLAVPVGRAARARAITVEALHVEHGLRGAAGPGRRRASAPALGATRRAASTCEPARTSRRAPARPATPPPASTRPGRPIATGHTLTDQAETVVYRLASLVRPARCAGDAARAAGELARPLLCVTADGDARVVRAAAGSARAIDETNADRAHPPQPDPPRGDAGAAPRAPGRRGQPRPHARSCWASWTSC